MLPTKTFFSTVFKQIRKISIALITALAALMIFTACAQENSPPQPDSSNYVQPADSAITQTLRDQLAGLSYIPVNEVNITTKNGIVTLKGTIGNVLAKEQAARTAEYIAGVRSVINNLVVVADRPDAQVETDVQRAIAVDPATEDWEINASVDEGVVSLKGVVDSWQERQLVANIVKSVKGVTGIQNDIIVNYSGTRTDRDIKAEVKHRLKWDGRINDKLIEVDVNDAEVSLSGSVGSLHEKRLARNIAHVTGVTKVNDSELEIHPEFESRMVRSAKREHPTEENIKKAVNDAFEYDPRVTASEVSVTISDNVATLSGTVDNFNEKLAAGQDANNTYGIGQVQNNIDVQNKVVVTPSIPTTDKAITNRIQAALNRDPYVDLVNYKVSVRKGMVTLTGTTDTEFLQQHAAKVASNVKGVVAVNNKIKVE